MYLYVMALMMIMLVAFVAYEIILRAIDPIIIEFKYWRANRKKKQ